MNFWLAVTYLRFPIRVCFGPCLASPATGELIFLQCLYEFWPMTLIFKPNLNREKMNEHANYLGQRSFRLYSICRIQSGFRLDSVKPSILCANLNPDLQIQFWHGLISETGSKRKWITMTWLPTTPANPDHSICQWIQIRIHYETKSRFGQIEYGLNSTVTVSKHTVD